ncbi:MAG: hypothetical protein ACRDL8_02385 [Solirubrobacteraceae bacterium]
MHQILARGEGFGHRQHVELTRRYLREHDPDAARGLVADAIRKMAAAHGASDKFHATITGAWVRCVAVHGQRWPADSFDEFIALNTGLLDARLLEQHFSRGLLFSDEARATIVEPDLRPLPVLAA